MRYYYDEDHDLEYCEDDDAYYIVNIYYNDICGEIYYAYYGDWEGWIEEWWE